MLLDAYAIIDKGVASAISKAEESRKVKLACREGCSECCTTHADIPVYPLELFAIYWYCTEKLTPSATDTLLPRLSSFGKGDQCPFLLNKSCSIHPIRPVACRQFNVFGSPCAPGEDPYYTRRHDVMVPIQGYVNQAFLVMLPFYGINDDLAKKEAIKNNFIHTQARSLKEHKWSGLIKAMKDSL
ncbi:MAG: YkgJ family cysteine cluster protein [Nitrospirae bacterium]|nr:YkgJ family cysteine cluster protein [Nitrospirota bacterium]